MLTTKVENFVYEERDGFIFIKRYNQTDVGVEPMLEVPDTINGLYVTGIAKDALAGVQTTTLLLPLGLAVVDLDFSSIKGLNTVVIPTICVGYVDNGGVDNITFNVDINSPFHRIASEKQYKSVPFPSSNSISEFLNKYIDEDKKYIDTESSEVYVHLGDSDGEGNMLYVATSDFDLGYTDNDSVYAHIIRDGVAIKSEVSLPALEVGTKLVKLSL